VMPPTPNGRISRISQQSSKRANSLEIDEAVITRSMRSSGDRN
jgi:hypothetical protein